MIFNNIFYQLLSEISIDMYPNIAKIVLFFVLLFLGFILKIKDTKEVIKCIFHPIFIFISVLCVIWLILISLSVGYILIKYYSSIGILLTFIFQILYYCITSYKLASDDSFLKKIITNNFEIKEILKTTVLIIMTQLTFNFTFNLYMIFIEFIKSLLLPFILTILYIPIMYIIAVINEYLDIIYLLPILSKDITIYDVIKKCNVNLRCLNRFNRQLYSKNHNNYKIYKPNESEFKLTNNKIYMGDELIGSYECNVEIPKISGKMNEAYTKEKNIYYIVGDSELENLSEKIAFVYFKYNNTNMKLFIENKYAPMQLWSPLIEDICFMNVLSKKYNRILF